MSPQRFEPGQIVFDRYVVIEKLGEGGMGAVWRVRHRALEADRALKIISSRLAFDPQIRGRFKREAQVMARFHHPNAVTVHDAQLTDNAAFIEMEFVQGRSLDKLLTRGVPMPLDRAARLLAQLCDVLQVAHEHRIVHRDLKPSNLMLVDGPPPGQDVLKVLDFGLAKILEAEEADGVTTMPGVFMGTPPYASPEQAEGHADERSDIYSVGVILYVLLTGHRPFSGNRMISDTLHRPPPPFAAVNPEAGVPPGVERLVLRCLAKDPAERPQMPRDLAEEFLRAIARPADELTPPPPPIVPRRSRRIGIGAVLLLLVAVGAWIGSHRGRTPSIPEGYAAAPGAGIGVGLPRVLVRRADGTRFLRIDGTGETPVLTGGNGGVANGPPPAARPVRVPTVFMQEFEVTNGEMDRFFSSDPALVRPRVWQEAYDHAKRLDPEHADRHPAVGIPHDLAERYAAWARGRLPTEAEWEYAARSRGRPDRPFVWGEQPAPKRGEERANLDRSDAPEIGTRPVGTFPQDRTEQGVRDLTGNVREWCRDPEPDAGTGPGGPGTMYAVRGGSWASYADTFSTTARELLDAAETLPDLGFRIVLEPGSPAGIAPDR